VENRPSNPIAAYVAEQINALLHDPNESATRAALAKLRRGLGKEPGSEPDAWPYTLKGLNKLNPYYFSANGVPTHAEWATHLAMTLFALHQQSSEPKRAPMHRAGVSLGTAVRQLVNCRGLLVENAIKRRLDALMTADSIAELSRHLRSMVQLLRAESIALDYAQLAEDIVQFQNTSQRNRVRLRWGQDYYTLQEEEPSHDEQAE
jgi:CRISPR system Cascade subunit CasB